MNVEGLPTMALLRKGVPTQNTLRRVSVRTYSICNKRFAIGIGLRPVANATPTQRNATHPRATAVTSPNWTFLNIHSCAESIRFLLVAMYHFDVV